MGKRKIVKGSDPEDTKPSTPTIYFLAESPPRGTLEALSQAGVNTEVLTYSDLGLLEGTSDPPLVDEFAKKVAMTSKIGFVLTQDRGKGDKIMPHAIEQASESTGVFLTHITYSAHKGSRMPTSLSALFRTPGFKDFFIDAKRYKKFFLTPDHKVVAYKRKGGSVNKNLKKQ